MFDWSGMLAEKGPKRTFDGYETTLHLDWADSYTGHKVSESSHSTPEIYAFYCM